MFLIILLFITMMLLLIVFMSLLIIRSGKRKIEEKSIDDLNVLEDEKVKDDEIIIEDVPPHSDVKMCTVWDLEQLKTILDDHVIGQNHAVRTIKKIIKQATENPLNYNLHEFKKPKHHLVFLVGGPGVGKNFTIKLISKCLKLQELTRYKIHETKLKSHETYRNYGERYLRSVLTLPENHENLFGVILTNLHLDILPFLSSDKKQDILDCRTFLSIALSYLKRPGILFKPIHFVTGTCIPDTKLLQFKKAEEYEEFIEEFSENLSKNMQKYFPQYDFTIVKFKPLTMVNIRKALPRDVLSSVTPIPISEIREDFVPHGCKLLLQKNDTTSMGPTPKKSCNIM